MVTSTLVVTLVFFCHICLTLVSAANNITTNEFLGDSDTLVSSNGRFIFGFFSPLNSTNRYVGIWYNTDQDSDAKEVVWVANRNNPINDSSGVLKISVGGNLQLSDEKELIYWSSNISHEANSTAVAQLQDTGNLVLLSSALGKIVWQSFEHLTNSLLPHTRVSIDLSIVRSLDEDVYPILRSWKSTSDPSTGPIPFEFQFLRK